MADQEYVSPRQEWLREAISKTRDFIESAVQDYSAELQFSRPSTWDYDAATPNRSSGAPTPRGRRPPARTPTTAPDAQSVTETHC